MENEKIKNLLEFYLLATELKDKIRRGWKIWNIDRERVESVAEHIYGTCILSISIDSEFELDIDIYKVVMMIVLHEIEEIKIGDLTPFDKVTKEEKRKLGKQAVEEILNTLNKKVQYIELIEEFENMKTKESIFAKMCDKLESDIQCKLYCEEHCLDVNKSENKSILGDERIQKLIENGSKTISDFWVENHKNEILHQDKVFEEIADYIKKNTLLKGRNMLKNKKVIIFDMDGTLIDSVGIWNAIDEELIKTIGEGTIDDVDIAKQRDDKLKEYKKEEDPYLEYCGFLKGKYHATMSKEEIKKIRYDIAKRYLKEKVDYKPNAEKVIKYLKEKGYILAIASTTNQPAIDCYKIENKNIINKANLEDYFSIIYARNDVNAIKPNPEVHDKIMEKLHVKPEECLIVEDALVGVEAANNANIEVAVIYDKYSDSNREKINQLSQYQFKDFDEMLKEIKKELEE